MRQAPVALVVALVVVLAGAGAALAGKGDPKKQIRAADQAWAMRINLQASDLGPGWKAERSSSQGDDNLRCPGFEPDESDLTVTGEADSPDFSRPDGTFVASSVGVYITDAQARTSWSRVARPGLVRCLALLVKQQSTKDIQVRVTGAGPLAFAHVAPRTAAYRLRAVFTAQGTKLVGTFDVILEGRGRVNVALFAFAIGGPFAPDRERTLARAVAGRLVG